MTGVLTKIDCTLCENSFGRYCVPKSSQHRPAPQDVLRGRVWELNTINFMRNHVVGRDIVHAGMFFGDFLPGLGAERKQAFMRIASKEGKALGGASRVVDDTRPRDDEGIDAISLVKIDEALPAAADVGIIQLDVEGYEASALAGGIQTIQRCLPIIIVETVPTAFVTDHLVPLGYSRTGTVCGNSIFTT
jgi:hypothetical protein